MQTINSNPKKTQPKAENRLNTGSKEEVAALLNQFRATVNAWRMEQSINGGQI